MHIDAHRSSSKHSKKNPYILSPDRHLDDMAKGEWISKIIRASFPSYLLRQTPRMHWDLRWSDVETLLVFSSLKHLWGQKLHPVGVLKSSVFLCRNVALPKALLYSAICSGAIVLILLLPWGRHWHRTAKGSTSTYHRQYAVYNRIRRQRSGGPMNWNLAITFATK